MRIRSLLLENYRAHANTSVDFSDLTALIGRNGSGKSSILSALDAFYDTSYKPDPRDFYDRNTDLEIAITVEFYRLNASEAARYSEYLDGDRFTVRKRVPATSGCRYYCMRRQLPEFAEIRRLEAKSDRLKAFNQLVDDGKFPSLSKQKSDDAVQEAMRSFETTPDNTYLLEPREEPVQFLGPANIGGGGLDNDTRWLLVPAVHDAVEETGAKGVVGRLVDTIVKVRLATHPDLVEFQQKFEAEFRELYSPQNLGELDSVSDEITGLLSTYHPGASLGLEWLEPQPPPLSPPRVDTLVGDPDFRTDVTRQGHGLQRTLILTLLQYFATQGQSAPVEEETPVAEHPIPDLIIAIEEPELYLHPAQCRHLSAVLLDLASREGPPHVQIIYTSHSPYFAGMDRFLDIRIVRRTAVQDGDPPCCTISALDFDAARGQLAAIAQLDPDTITAPSFMARCSPVLDTVMSEGYFAQVAVVVEGWGDAAALLAVQQQLKLDWDAKGIVVVPARSKNSIDRPVIVFQNLDIPTYFVFDADGNLSTSGNAEARAGAVKANRSLLELAGVAGEDFPPTQVHESWAVLGESLDTELKEGIGDDWVELAQAVQADLGLPGLARLLKNSDGVAELIKRAYDAGHSFPNLEQIAQRITNIPTT